MVKITFPDGITRNVASISTYILTNNDFKGLNGNACTSAAANVAITLNQWSPACYYQVPAQTIVQLGAADPTGGTTVAGTPGYCRFDNLSGAGQITGAIRVVATTNFDQALAYEFNDSTVRWSASQTDRTLAKLIDPKGVYLKEDSRIYFQINPSALSGTVTSATIDFADADTLMRLPVTVYYLA